MLLFKVSVSWCMCVRTSLRYLQVSMQEFEGVMEQIGITCSNEIKAAFKAIDQDGIGTINYSEFIAASYQEKMFLNVGSVTSCFNSLDLDGDGSIDASELGKLMPTAEAKELVAILKEADSDGDGKISLSEFKIATASTNIKATLRRSDSTV